eukprot:1483044-Pleurochrysis_carterae.AAC.1
MCAATVLVVRLEILPLHVSLDRLDDVLSTRGSRVSCKRASIRSCWVACSARVRTDSGEAMSKLARPQSRIRWWIVT